MHPAVEKLLASRTPAGIWEGRLSSSALSNATATFALSLYVRAPDLSRPADQLTCLRALISRGLDWLQETQNADGGWGDTTLSISNISTTALCWAALTAASESQPARRAEAWLRDAAGSTEPADLARAITSVYGKDKTFSVPILTMCALAGRLGDAATAWKLIPGLPFELAACPHQWFAALRLPVVSYALPALIAIGQVHHAHRPTRNPVLRLIRNLAIPRTLRVLRSIQPSNGGFLEATPLTSFVAMSLLASGAGPRHPVVLSAIDFLKRSARPDGSWPIDTNLSTWLTTLATNALALHPDFESFLPLDQRRRVLAFLLNQQFSIEHPYTHAAPGGWSWTNLPGAVPDADDTAGALISLYHLTKEFLPNQSRDRKGAEESNAVGSPQHPLSPTTPDQLSDISHSTLPAARAAITWLLNLQNRDGGIPTFCKGWGALPFDRSGADLTAHAIHAFSLWKPKLPAIARRIGTATRRALAYLAAQQRPDGSWLPLWFGNQHHPDFFNPIYGTARVLTALAAVDPSMQPQAAPLISRALRFLLESQSPAGSWTSAGADHPGTIEETAVAISALAAASRSAVDLTRCGDSISRGQQWLQSATESFTTFPPAPIGFYFANLWYFETLYPLIFTVAACAL